jgi:hypothetical protein
MFAEFKAKKHKSIFEDNLYFKTSINFILSGKIKTALFL